MCLYCPDPAVLIGCSHLNACDACFRLPWQLSCISERKAGHTLLFSINICTYDACCCHQQLRYTPPAQHAILQRSQLLSYMRKGLKKAYV